MKTKVYFYFMLVFPISIALVAQSCKKHETESNQLSMTVNLSRSLIHNDLYYSMDYRERSLELDFSESLDTSTIRNNISFSEKNGLLDSLCTITFYGSKVFLFFKPKFELIDGWKYLVTIKTGLKSTQGMTLKAATTLEIRTTSAHLFLENDSSARNTIVCISDIHMGEARSVTLGYGWFSKNAAALDDLLDAIAVSSQIRELVILGDLFDGWVVPYRLFPFDTSAGINNIRDYFISVANAPTNVNIISKLKNIASGGAIRLIYIPGNHDMLLTQAILNEIIPGIIWQGDSAGLGRYTPLPEIIAEHGHRYDFFNCPQPLANPGHILPPGYFISRLEAEGQMEKGTLFSQITKTGNGSLEFLTAWVAAVEYLKYHYSLTVAADSLNIKMSGIDNYTGPVSFNTVRDMYAENIEQAWPATQIKNALPVSMPVVMAILDGNTDLYFTAAYEFMQSMGPNPCRVVAFGHTHNPMLKVYPSGNQYKGIYANSGSWVNTELSSKPVRTFLVIKPGKWSGSDLDIVSLFQYNLESGSGNPVPDYIPVLLDEESILRAK